MNYAQESIRLHKKLKGKISIRSKAPVRSAKDLSLLYTPGVAAVSQLIARKRSAVFDYTQKSNAVAVVTDGSAVLGLGNIGPEAALPVMEGKAVLFRELAGVDAYPICLTTQKTEEIIQAVKAIAAGFGGINLEDISAPRCFAIEERLQAELDIPVMHDDQHGAAVAVLAGLLNALRVIRKNIKNVRIIVNGAGAAAIASVNLLLRFGVPGHHLIVLDSRGVIYHGRDHLNVYKRRIAARTNGEKIRGDLPRALVGADVFIGFSVGGSLAARWVAMMADNPVVFALANPEPEISLREARRTKVKVFGTGRSDYPNQINNALVFPGMFRGALDARAPAINDRMKIAAAMAIAGLVPSKKLSSTNILPSPLDKRVVPAVATAVSNVARRSRARN